MISLALAFAAGAVIGLLVGALLAAAGTSDAAGEAHAVSGETHGQSPP